MSKTLERKIVQRQQRKMFSPEEDQKLILLVEQHGTKSWEKVATFLPGRSGRQCRDRYSNYLKSGITKREWTPEEDALLIKYYKLLGPHWVEISKLLNGRSGNNVKNRWHKYISKNIIHLDNQFLPKAEKPVYNDESIQAKKFDIIISEKLKNMIMYLDTDKKLDLFPPKPTQDPITVFDA